jgi:hypothetical protein
MEFNDEMFNNIKKKTNVDKEDLINIASRLNQDNMKDRDTLSGIIRDLSRLAGKDVSQEKEDKIIDLIMKDKVPSNIDKLFK